MTSNPIHALPIPVETVRPITLDPQHTASAIAAEIGCDIFAIVGLRDGIDVFVDDEGILTARRSTCR